MTNFSFYDNEHAFDAKTAALLIVGVNDTDSEKRDIAQVLRRLEQAYELALDHYDTVSKSDAADKWTSPDRPEFNPAAIRSVRMMCGERYLPDDPKGGTLHSFLEQDFRQFNEQTFDREELQRWLSAVAMPSIFRFSNSPVARMGVRRDARATERADTERWTLHEAAVKLAERSLWIESADRWLAYLRKQVKARALQPIDDEVLADDINALLDADPHWRSSGLRLPSAKQDDIETVRWDSDSMHAAYWFDMATVSPREAASLLCQHDPLDDRADPERTTNLETGPADFALTLRLFEDAHRINPTHRTLLEWITIATSRGCKTHSWIDEYLGARARLGCPVTDAAIKPSWPEADPTRPEPQSKPVQRSAAQDAAILSEITRQGHDPKAIPKNESGKAGVKADIRAALKGNALFAGTTVFNKAWERLTASGDVAITSE